MARQVRERFGPSRFAKGEKELTELCDLWNAAKPGLFQWRGYDVGHEKAYDLFHGGILLASNKPLPHVLCLLRFTCMALSLQAADTSSR